MVTSILVGLVIFFAIAVVGVRIFGIQPFAVLSGSMEPAYHTGAVIYVQDIDPNSLEVGDVITFWVTEEAVATHRIIEVLGQEDSLQFRTKGDANEIPDGNLVLQENVIGKVIFTLPYFGYLVQFIQGKTGHYALIFFSAFLMLMLILPELLFDSDKEGKEEKEGEKEKGK